MISQGQFARQHDYSGGKPVVQQAENLYHFQESNMEEIQRKHGKESVQKVEPKTLEPTVESDVHTFVVPNLSCIAGSGNASCDVAQDDDEQSDDELSTCDRENGENDINRSAEMSDNMLDVRHDRGMRTRGNRRPILLTERMRQKRQTLQDMAKPLKAWLYEHKDNPYPTKTEKALLAVGSQMTLVQVSNWFANARRRLKNTVRHPGLSWSKRIKMYNSHVTGNAERLSICSSASSISDVAFEDEEVADDMTVSQLNCYETVSNYSSRPPSTMSQDPHMSAEYMSPDSPHDEGAHHKSQHSILHRYLNDSFEHAQRYQQQHHHQNAECTARRRNGSGTGSVSSHDYEDVSLSRLSPQMTSNETYQQDFSSSDISTAIKNRLDSSLSSKEEEDTYWKEINAALALTNMARSCRQQLPIVSCFR
ncbi:homeobox protein Mohawk-like isoform X2 [Amphiura filiformis]|uniref:homeobox protein Mohawk-like isoform X2 n=2 Tax=Amphiura filiformis TaxID=82378 RepID=UPI003B20BADF